MKPDENDAASLLTPYYRLDPDTVLQAIESVGLVTDGRLLALNSYENRVYQVGIEGEQPVIAKFYRPGRWSDEQILEEHAFALELAEAEIPMIAPMLINDSSLHHDSDFRFALLFHYLTAEQVGWKVSTFGGITTALTLTIGSRLFIEYMRRFGASSLVGVTGSVLVGIVWIYSIAQIILAGAELTRTLQRQLPARLR